MRQISSWGCLSGRHHNVISLPDPFSTPALLIQPYKGVTLGMGRSYGDACLNAGGLIWDSTGLDHFIAFDCATGCLTCEAGVLLREIQKLVVPEGWMLPVTPGTQMVTVGGAVASDVHGKNHHRMGTFGDHVRHIKLLRTNGEVIICGPDLRPEWFFATLGGMGLTGIIIEASIQLRKVPGPWLETETIPYANIDEFFSIADASEDNWEYTVSWIDCVASRSGRGLFMRANHKYVEAQDFRPGRKLSVPITPPVSLINRLSLRPFNETYFYLNKSKTARQITHYQPFFYPLDNLQHWNRLYGPKGFYQYQSVVPLDVGPQAITQMLTEIGRSGQGSFLAVLKTFGSHRSSGMLSFPQPGVTLALDFPNHGARTHALFERLDNIVRQAGGRIYLAKDARMPRDLFESGYPSLNEFLKYRDPGISSEMSRRLMGY